MGIYSKKIESLKRKFNNTWKNDEANLTQASECNFEDEIS